MPHPFPPSTVTAEAPLRAVFCAEAAALGMNPDDAQRMFEALPAPVQAAPALQFSSGPDWRYAFGSPFHLAGTLSFRIPHQAPLVASLVRAVRVAQRAIATPQLYHAWWLQIAHPAKHFDAIVEMLAVANVAPEHGLTYEPPHSGIRRRRIDWLVWTKDQGNFLLEVKNRPGHLAQELLGRQPAGATTAPDFAALFKSTTSKFMPVDRSVYIQGVLLFLGNRLPPAPFAAFFRDRLQANLHFVALAQEDKATGLCVDLFTASLEVEGRVIAAFRWRERGIS
jgi:hypothetical protein